MSNKATDKDYLLRQLHLFEDDVLAQRTVASEEGYHNFRFYNDKFSYKSGNSWEDIDFIIPITQADYDLLPASEINKDVFYWIVDAFPDPGPIDKADKVANATDGNLAGLDSTGNLTDSGKAPSDFADVFQFSTMPTASQDNLGLIVQYTGATTSTYTNGYWYKCIFDDPDYIWENIQSQDVGDSIIWLTKAEYEALNPPIAGQLYGITDWNPDESATLFATLEVDTINWITDTTSQSGVTLYKKQVPLSNVYNQCPDVSIGVSSNSLSPLPSTAQQEAFNLVKYVTIDDVVPCIYLYAKSTPETTFYITVKGVNYSGIIPVAMGNSDGWTNASQVSNGQVTFTELDDTKGWGYKPFVNITASSTNKNPSMTINSMSGVGTASMSITYDTDADEDAYVKLRIFK